MKRILFYFIFAVLVFFIVQPAFSFSSRAIPAKACVIMNDDDAILYAKNPSAKLPPASTVKLMTAMVALDTLNPDTVITVSRFASRTRSSRPRLRAGDALTVSDLLHLALMKSTNSAAVALAEAAAGSEDEFVVWMNRKAGEVGANDSYFRNASGLPKPGQYTTALDLTTILKHALTYPLIREIIGKKASIITTVDGRVLSFGNTDALLWYRDDMVGGKTGFTNNARHCFVGAVETERGIMYAAVLGAPTRNRLWRSTMMLVDLGMRSDLASSVTSTLDETPVKDQKQKATSKKKPKLET